MKSIRDCELLDMLESLQKGQSEIYRLTQMLASAKDDQVELIDRLGGIKFAEKHWNTPKDAPYGYCPICGEKGISRERGINGNDVCAKGHKYPSRSALTELPDPGEIHC